VKEPNAQEIYECFPARGDLSFVGRKKAWQPDIYVLSICRMSYSLLLPTMEAIATHRSGSVVSLLGTLLSAVRCLTYPVTVNESAEPTCLPRGESWENPTTSMVPERISPGV
jgi:hypothetical protein